MELNKIYCMDCLEGLKQLENESIDMVLTSPPYDDLRKYNGYSWDFEGVTKELFRVIKKGGVVVWIVGDSMIKGSKSLKSYEQAIKFKEYGFNMFDVIIYEKTSPSPPHKNRYFNSFEYMFILSKGKPKTINLLKDRPNKNGGKISGKVTRRESNGDLTEKKQIKIQEFGVRTNVWKYAVGNNKSAKDKIAFKHPAIFPEKLAEDHILSWSNKNDIILDIFMGSGTTAKMCLLNNRNYIGFEISEEYCQIAEERIKQYKNEQN